ncbi:DUF2269 family protein [Miltoncostaea marina]|uniref:DUF2269 family protein n=1 Tax=Miltoncostaea marina TaxID=2843215 RepID=UPI001C3E6D10|nr:DUF2269 family protein [Miltoncostaea marina]
MPPLVRKTTLTAHVVSSVGWLGSVIAFLVLAALGFGGGDPRTVSTVYVSLDPLASFAVLPLGIAALLTGVLQALGTPWGLIRHHWVLAKLVLTAVATGLLVLHLDPIRDAAEIARSPSASPTDLGELRGQLVVYASAALVALTAATALSVFKPAGRTRWGRRREQAGHRRA